MKDSNKNILVGVLIAIVIILLLALIVVVILKDDDYYENKINNNNSGVVSDYSNTKNENYISKDQALEIVLQDIKLNKNDLYDLDIERDYKYNEEVYEINFEYDHYEYEYYVNASTGQIVHSFKERD